MYDPSVGRWLEEDPIGFEAGDADLYRYLGNAPTNTTVPVNYDTYGGSPGWWQERRQEENARILEAASLRRRFSQALAVWQKPEYVRILENSAPEIQEVIRTEEEKLTQMKDVQKANEKNFEMDLLISSQVRLQQKLVSRFKADVALRKQQLAIRDAVNKLDKTAADYASKYTELELQFLRAQEEFSSDQIMEIRRQLRNATDAVDKALNPPNK